MNGFAPGLWDILDAILRFIGKGTAWLLRGKVGSEGEYAVYAMIGGAVVCTLSGAAIGFAVSDLSRSAVAAGAIVGGLLGLCLGIFFGASVDTIDSTINDVLSSLNSKLTK